jgi:hypothetical protein
MYIKAVPVPVGHPGIDYLECLGMISGALLPRSYFEIGTNTGLSLNRFTCDAVCVDPEFRIQNDVFRNKTRLSFFQMTSDEFFTRTDLPSILPDGIDVAFLDGMHRFEYLLRDFINTEKFCHERSLVLMHDCLPPTIEMAERYSATQINWAGDVWKLLPILRKYRADLRIKVLDCPPTGLVACTRLDPSSDFLSKSYYQILDEFSSARLDDAMIAELWHMYPTLDTKLLSKSPHDLTMLF